MNPAEDRYPLSRYVSPCARVALDNVLREYPNKPDHLLVDGKDLRNPRALHPTFYGSYDWHSSVHMHWLDAKANAWFGRDRRYPAIYEPGGEDFMSAGLEDDPSATGCRLAGKG